MTASVSAGSRGPWRRRLLVLSGISTAILAIAVFGGEYARRQGLYWYDVRQDYRYCFTAGAVHAYDVELDANGFVFPEHVRHRWDTALLEFKVRSTLSGRWFEPSLAVRVEDGPETRQYFERRADGTRFAELGGPPATPPVGFVRLRGHHLTWESQTGKLLLFDNQLPEDPRILVLAPHPDDAEIAAFGLYAGSDAHVVTVTTGSYPDDSYRDLAPDPASRDDLNARLRVWDSLVGPRWAGLQADRAINLGYFTLTLEQMYADPESKGLNPVTGSADIERYRRWTGASGAREELAQPTWGNLVADLTTLLRVIRPNVIVAPHPVLDAAKDHAYTAVALFQAIESLADLEAKLLLYSNHPIFTDYFPFGPADGRVTLAPWFDCSLLTEGIYSHPLTEEEQVDKLFALDAMHDLRPKPHMELGGPIRRTIVRTRRALTQLWRDPAGESSYFRRSARPNEVFFVYSTTDKNSASGLISALNHSSRE